MLQNKRYARGRGRYQSRGKSQLAYDTKSSLDLEIRSAELQTEENKTRDFESFLAKRRREWEHRITHE